MGSRSVEDNDKVPDGENAADKECIDTATPIGIVEASNLLLLAMAIHSAEILTSKKETR